jgi:class 3 adenylate cyclase
MNHVGREPVTEVDLKALLADVDGDVSVELASKPEVVDKGHDLDVDSLPIIARKWHKATDVVAVVADMKNSTQLGLNKHAASTASIYEASTGGIVQIFNEFDADFIAIQGDGAFALFWGERRMNRAICSGITVKTFSQKYLVPRLERKWPELPTTGLKVGIANSPILVKQVGIPRTTHKEPVWAGRAVNYAAKAAQQADAGEMIITGTVWDWASGNDYLAATCSCGSVTTDLWSDVTISKIPDDDGDREGKLLTTTWCDIHGPEFCEAILAGKKRRNEQVTKESSKALANEMNNPLRMKAAVERRNRLARYVGLR